MRLKGGFLRSTVARRVFLALLVTALLPLLAFGGLAYQALHDHFEVQVRRDGNEMAKNLGMRVFDRLTSAQAALGALAEVADWQSLAPPSPGLSRVLARVATASSPYGKVSGDPALADLWRRASAAASTPGQTLWWLPETPDQRAHVLIGQPDRLGRGWWLAEVEPGFVWADFAPDGAGGESCVTDAQDRTLNCPGAATARASASSWPLFLKATFGSVDWRFSVPMPAAPTLGDASVGDWALQVGLATVLLISLLGLVLVRRTMVPLERLTTATGALAAGRWDTRVVLPADDEFGQLAQSLNAMAGRIDDQMQTLAAHAAIDRAILDGVDVAGVIRRVADRLRALAPGAHTAVLLCGEGPADWVVHARGGPAQPLAVASDFDPGGVDDLGLRAPSTAQMPPWVRDALKLPASAAMACCWAQAPGQGKPAALLLMAGPPPWQPDADQRLALLDLRDRVAVTLDAAARERRLLDRALRDGLTGLLNRHGLQDEAETLLAGSDAARPSAMMFVDLDGFKQVNDAMGHHMGDELLRAVAGRLRQAVPAEALLARPGGDEFVIVLPGPAADAERMAAALCKVLSDRFQLADQPVHVGASIGISLYPDDGLTLSDLMRRADLAMYAAKTGGRGAWRRFTPALEDRVTERAWMVRDLRQALVQDGLLLHYQPRVDARSGELSSVEALVRWPHPQRGMVPPDRFIPVAEDSGLIERLGVFVLETALAQLKRWRADGVRVPCVAVNVSARQLLDDSFTGTVLARLARHGLAPSDLELEITESLFVGDSGRVSALLEPLRAAGVSMAMDDFGTGYSSLAALHSLPFDVLKIDRSFVAALDGPRSSDAVVRSVLLLARELGKHVVAEGVETDTQRTRLLALGCDQFQGYLFARPMAGDALAQHPLAARNDLALAG